MDLEQFEQALTALLNLTLPGQGLDEWEFEIRYEDRRYTILCWKPAWATDSPGIGVVCPTGAGATLTEAINDLKSKLRNM